MQCYECEGLACQFFAYCELLFVPNVFVCFGLAIYNDELIFCQSNLFIALSGEYQVYVFSNTLLQLISKGDHVASLEGVLCLEEVEVFVGSVTEDACCRTTNVSFVPSEFCIKAISYDVCAEQALGEPPAPCGQVVLCTDVIPFLVVLTHALPVEVLTVTEVEVSHERFFAQIPLHRTASSHECRHTVVSHVVCVIFH